VSAECYPAAKAGGLGDVVGALPKYLNAIDYSAAVLLPKYRTPWVRSQSPEPIYAGAFQLHNDYIPYTVEAPATDNLGFPLLLVNISGKFDRPGIYGDPSQGWYTDNAERYLYFQQAVLDYIINGLKELPEIVHCHDHHTGLIPFLMKHSLRYQALKNIPSVFTIHNAEYDGAFAWNRMELLPAFDAKQRGLIDWNNQVNPLASGIKNAWVFTTVSPTYMEELSQFCNGLEWLIRNEKEKAMGILNGIDTQVWNPALDPMVKHHFTDDIQEFKRGNKEVLAERFRIDPRFPLVTFIGRLVREKGADLLPDLLRRVLDTGLEMAFVILGTGEPYLHDALHSLRPYAGRFDLALEYNEMLAHQLYAGSDFLIMPSRVEPCGLNQMYAMRYGTVPVVRSIGGLKDTVPDILESVDEGRGIRFDAFNLDDAHHALWRAYELYQKKDRLEEIRRRVMQVDLSWDRSARNYLAIYKTLNP